MIILEWKQFSIQIMQLCRTLKRMIKYCMTKKVDKTNFLKIKKKND